MRSFSHFTPFACLVLSCVLFTALASAERSALKVENVWAPATFKLAVTGAVYLNIENASGQDRTLISASVDKSIADSVEIHESFLQNEMARMRQLTDPVAIAANDHVAFEQGGKHIMLMGLKGPLEVDNNFTLTLLFDNDDSLTVNVKVTDGGAEDHSHHHHH